MMPDPLKPSDIQPLYTDPRIKKVRDGYINAINSELRAQVGRGNRTMILVIFSMDLMDLSQHYPDVVEEVQRDYSEHWDVEVIEPRQWRFKPRF